MDDDSGLDADAWTRVYFTGFTVFTLGIGDVVPGTTWAEICTALAVLTGLVLITVAITYSMQVVQAVVERRAIALHVAALGEDGASAALQSWNGRTFGSSLGQHLVVLTSHVTLMGQKHLAYPVAHYFHPSTPAQSVAHTLVILEDLLTLLRCGVAPDVRPARDVTEPLWRAIGQTLDLMSGRFFGPARHGLAVPSLDLLREAGVPTVSTDDYVSATDRHGRRRQMLGGLLVSDAWPLDPQ